ncbi:MAG: Gfo/Idh/MocA family protein [Anaerolineae bacterium]
MIKIGIVGMGGMGWFHAARYLQLPNAKITAIADIVPERLEAKEAVQINIAQGEQDFDFSDVARYSEGNDLIEKADVDVVDICLPTYLHAPYAISALQAGHHVLCEKPMALGVEEASRMIATAEEANRLLMIAQVVRFWPEYEFLRDQIQAETYGPLRSLNMWRMGGRPGWSPDNWFLNPALSGGAILDLHIHDVDYVNAVFGRPDQIYATGRISEAAKTYDIIHACFSYADGPQIHMHAGWSAAQIPFEAGFEAWFDRAFFRYDDGKLTIFDNTEKIVSHDAPVEPGDGYRNEIAYFLDCVETGRRPERCAPTSTRDSLILVQEELEAMRL